MIISYKIKTIKILKSLIDGYEMSQNDEMKSHNYRS